MQYLNIAGLFAETQSAFRYINRSASQVSGEKADLLIL
jgi:hypothetical protein